MDLRFNYREEGQGFLRAHLVSLKPLAILAASNRHSFMGRGDKKSKKGKRWKGSYGKTRNRKAIKARIKRAASKKPTVAKTEAKAKPARKVAKKAE